MVDPLFGAVVVVGILPLLVLAGGGVADLPGQFPLTANLDDGEGHLVDQVADLPGAVLLLFPLVVGMLDLRGFQIFYGHLE